MCSAYNLRYAFQPVIFNQFLNHKYTLIMQTKQEVLQACKVEGMTVFLPPVQLERSLYQETAKHLEMIGGKWNRKAAGFVFNEDPTVLLGQIAAGEKRNLKKEFQFYGTPDHLADRLVELAEIRNGMMVLEPSAGQGAIIKAINRVVPQMLVRAFELMPVNRTILEQIDRCELIGDDFLKHQSNIKFDRIIANPPFNKNQDIDHIYKMYLCCKGSGRIVTIASKHWQRSTNKKEVAFKNWLDEVNAEVIEISAGEFKESGTSIATCIIIIDK